MLPLLEPWCRAESRFVITRKTSKERRWRHGRQPFCAAGYEGEASGSGIRRSPQKAHAADHAVCPAARRSRKISASRWRTSACLLGRDKKVIVIDRKNTTIVSGRRQAGEHQAGASIQIKAQIDETLGLRREKRPERLANAAGRRSGDPRGRRDRSRGQGVGRIALMTRCMRPCGG